MPLAFDFTSTLVIGVTLPVATTLLAKSPFSTLASFEGSILVPPRVAANTPPAISSTITSANAAPDNQFATLLLIISVTVHNASWRYRQVEIGSHSAALTLWYAAGVAFVPEFAKLYGSETELSKIRRRRRRG